MGGAPVGRPVVGVGTPLDVALVVVAEVVALFVRAVAGRMAAFVAGAVPFRAGGRVNVTLAQADAELAWC